VARVLIVEGGDRALRLARELNGEGHAVRMVASAPEHREQVEAAGAQCLTASVDRLATLQGALEHVTIACWLLADAGGDAERVRALHGPRLEQFLTSAIDSTLRGFLYEAGGDAIAPEVLEGGGRIVSETAARNSIPVAILRADPADLESWLDHARQAIAYLLEGPGVTGDARYADRYTQKPIGF
jgi:hypothetical protein